jgi:hypothetical protein
MMERLTRKGSWDKIELAFRELEERQYQIAKALEECTGVKILQTEEEIMMENKRIQEERDALDRKFDQIFLEAEWEEFMKKQKSLPSKESKFKASSAPGQSTLDMRCVKREKNKK